MIDGKLVQRARPDSVVKALIQNGNDPGSGEPVFSEEGARKPALVECAKLWGQSLVVSAVFPLCSVS